MHKTSSLVLAAVCLVTAIGCGDDQDPEGAEALWERIHDEDYRSWSRAPGYESRKPSAAAHGNMVDIYVNEVVADVFAAGEPITAWPDGALIVKDGFDDGDFELVAAMEKRGADWYWVEWDAEGASTHSGKPAVCTDCHRSGADYVRAFGFPE